MENNDDDIMKYITTYDLTKIPKKKMNYKQYFNRQRLKYGKYIQMGLVNDKIKFKFKDGKLIYEIDNTVDKQTEDILLNDNFYKNLFYCSDLDFSIMPSKRELKLRKMLNERINKFKELTGIKKEEKENKDNKDNKGNKDKDKEKEKEKEKEN